jgi:voltage-gated potassium channel Kch
MATLLRIASALIVAAFLWTIGGLTTYKVAAPVVVIALLCLWALALFLAVLATIAIYAPDYKEFVSFGSSRWLAKFNPSKLHTLGYVAVSFALTIYLFAVVFLATCIFDKNAFNPVIDSLGTAIYFSIVTIATVGYGDIVPVSGFARFVVSIEILGGLAYGVFFLSVIAGFLREQ